MLLYDNPEIEPELYCVMDDDSSIQVINIPEGFFDLEPFHSGKTQVLVRSSGIKLRNFVLKSGEVSHYDVIDLTKGSGAIVPHENTTNRQLSSTWSGSFNVAVIRVTDNAGNSPTNTAIEISDHIFGTNNDSLNLVSGENCLLYLTFWFIHFDLSSHLSSYKCPWFIDLVAGYWVSTMLRK